MQRMRLRLIGTNLKVIRLNDKPITLGVFFKNIAVIARARRAAIGISDRWRRDQE
jgi:hypothetical protein